VEEFFDKSVLREKRDCARGFSLTQPAKSRKDIRQKRISAASSLNKKTAHINLSIKKALEKH